MPKHRGNLHVILISFVISFMLDLLSWHGGLVWWRPHFTLLTLLYWVFNYPNRVNVGWAFLLGLVLDVLYGNLLGMQTFAFVLVAYLLACWRVRLYRYSFFMQWLGVFSLLFVYKLTIFIEESFVGQSPGLAYWYSTITSTVLWPLWAVVLSLFDRHQE